jgi:hypothetical protein
MTMEKRCLSTFPARVNALDTQHWDQQLPRLLLVSMALHAAQDTRKQALILHNSNHH